MKGLFNKVLVALTITTLVAGSANGGFTDYLTAGKDFLVGGVSKAYNAINKESISNAYAKCTKENFVASAVAAKDAVVALPTTSKVVAGIAAAGVVGYLAKNQIAKLVNKFRTPTKNNNKQGGSILAQYKNVEITGLNANQARKDLAGLKQAEEYIETQLGRRNNSEAVSYDALVKANS